jgi:hypothetical protein
MTRRRKWAAVPGLVAVAALATTLSAYSGASSPEGRSPEQPIYFPHPQHVQKLGMNCIYCHFASNKALDPGMPAVGTCMGCHTVIGPNLQARDGQPARKSEALTKLVGYWNGGQTPTPIPWVRIHKVPEYVHFPHMRHVNAGVTCQTCHGQVQKMNQVYQAASLNMGWCINCHVNGYNAVAGKVAAGYVPTAADSAAPVKRARYDCSVCHY